MNDKTKADRLAVLAGALLALLTAVSLLSILLPRTGRQGYTAEIYQNGKLMTQIRLNEVQEPYTFTVIGSDGSGNTIEVRHGSIAIISADCPDKLCVLQGAASDSRLPITCLPHRLVILLRQDAREGSITTDITTY